MHSLGYGRCFDQRRRPFPSQSRITPSTLETPISQQCFSTITARVPFNCARSPKPSPNVCINLLMGTGRFLWIRGTQMGEHLTICHHLDPLTKTQTPGCQGFLQCSPILEIGFLLRSGLTHQPLLAFTLGVSSPLQLRLTEKGYVLPTFAES